MDTLVTILMKKVPKKRQEMLYKKSHLSAKPPLCLPVWLRAFCSRHLLSSILNTYHAGDDPRFKALTLARFKMPWEHVSTEFGWSILDLVVSKLVIKSRHPDFRPFLAQGALPNPWPACVRGLPSP